MRYLSIVFLLLILTCTSAQAATLYVDKDNACPGDGSTGNPYCSIQNAFNVVNPGDSIRIRDSATPYDSTNTLTRSGTVGSRIIIEPEVGHNPTLRYSVSQSGSPVMQFTKISYITVQNLTFDCGLNQTCSRYAIKMESNPGGNPTTDGVDMNGIEILNNQFLNWGGTAAQATSPGIDRAPIFMSGAGNLGGLPCQANNEQPTDPCPGVPMGVIIRGNTFSNVRMIAVFIAHAKNTLIEQNTFTGITCGRDVDATNAVGIKIIGIHTTGSIFRNNVFHDWEPRTSCPIDDTPLPPAPGFRTWAAIWCDVGPDDGIVERNLIYNIDQGNTSSANGTGMSMNIEADCNGWIVRNNVIRDTGYYGIAQRAEGQCANPSTWDTRPNEFLNNTVKGSMVRMFGMGAGKFVAKNNIVYGQNAGALMSPSLGCTPASCGTTYNYIGQYDINYNQYFDTVAGQTRVGQWGADCAGAVSFTTWKTLCGNCDANSSYGDPLFVNVTPGAEDLHICISAGNPAGCVGSSPALDSGTTLANVTNDFSGTTRPVGTAYDMGAYEAGGSQVPTTPILHYAFDESGAATTAADSSPSNLPGTLCSGSTCPQQGPTWISGVVANAISCDGFNDNVETADNTILDVTGDMSITFYAHPTLAPASSVILTKEDPTTGVAPFGVELVNTGTPRYLWYHHQTGGNGTSALEFTTYAVPTLATHHVGFVRTVADKTLKLYIDGILADTKVYTTDLPEANAVPMRICTGAGRVGYFAGRLDALRLFNVALSQPEMAALAVEGTGTFGGVKATHHRFYRPNTTEGSSPIAQEDASTKVRVGGTVNLRIGIANQTGGNLSQIVPLQCNVDGGTYFTLTNSCSTNPACLRTSTPVTNTSTTRLLTLDAGLTFTNGAYVSSAPPWPLRSMANNNTIENEYTVGISGLTQNQQVCCRPVYSDALVLFDTYNTLGCFTVKSGARIYR